MGDLPFRLLLVLVAFVVDLEARVVEHDDVLICHDVHDLPLT